MMGFQHWWRWRKAWSLWPGSGWSSSWWRRVLKPSAWWGPTSSAKPRSPSKAWVTPRWAWTTVPHCRATPVPTGLNLNMTQVETLVSQCFFFYFFYFNCNFDPPPSVRADGHSTPHLQFSAAFREELSHWHSVAVMKIYCMDDEALCIDCFCSPGCFILHCFLWSHSEWTHHVAGGSLQSSSTQGSKHGSRQRSGDHEEAVQVAHA